MEDITNIPKDTGFYEQLFKKVLFTAGVVTLLSLSYVLWVNENSDNLFLPFLIVGLALAKMIFIVRLTFIQLSKIIGESHQLTHVLTLFAVLIVLIILSFSADYLALYVLNSENFKSATSLEGSFFKGFFHLNHFLPKHSLKVIIIIFRCSLQHAKNTSSQINYSEGSALFLWIGSL